MKSLRKIITEPTINNSFSVHRLDNASVGAECYERLTYHRIISVENGAGVLTIDEHRYAVKRNDLFLMSKGQVYHFEEHSTISGYVISFGDCFWEKTPKSASNCKAVLFNNAGANQRLQLSDPEMMSLSCLMSALLTEYKLPSYLNQMDALASYLKIIMIKLANVSLTEEATADNPDYLLYRKFTDMLSTTFRNQHTVNGYAAMLHVTARTLSEICKRCSGTGAKEMINGQIVAEARRLLQFSSDTVKEIAYTLNFSTPEQFSHFFKKHTQIAPSDYRNQFVSMGM